MKKKQVLVYISVLLSMLFWGMSYIWMKVVYQFYNPITTVFLRLLIAAPVQFLVVIGLKKLQKIRKEDFPYLIMISLLQPFLYFLCESYGIKFVSPTIAAVITLLAGILILAWPKAFRIILGIYLLIVGLVQLVDLNL